MIVGLAQFFDSVAAGGASCSANFARVEVESGESNMRGPSMIPRGLANGSPHPAFAREILIHSPCCVALCCPVFD